MGVTLQIKGKEVPFTVKNSKSLSSLEETLNCLHLSKNSDLSFPRLTPFAVLLVFWQYHKPL